MKNTTLLIIAGIVILVIGGFIFLNSSKTPATGNATADGNTQKIVLSYKNGNYYPNTITVKSGEKVSISLDNSIQGCLRSFTIPAFGVSKYLPNPADSVEFTPDKAGTYKFQCSMGMGTGTLVVN